MKKSARVSSHFRYHTVNDSSDEDATPLPVTTSLKHVHFNAPQNGLSRFRTTYVVGGASPDKRPDVCASPGPEVWNSEPAPPELNTTNYPWLDPAYQHQFDLESHTHQIPAPRVRTAGVSHLNFPSI